MSKGRVIDLHAHVVLEEGFGVAGKFGPELSRDENGPFFRIGDYRMNIEYRGTVFMETDLRLERMDKDGIDLQLLSPNPLTMFHHIPAATAVKFCKVHNDAMRMYHERPDERRDPIAGEVAHRELALPPLAGPHPRGH